MSLQKDPFSMETASPFPTPEILEASRPHAQRFQPSVPLGKTEKTRAVKRKKDGNEENQK